MRVALVFAALSFVVSWALHALLARRNRKRVARVAFALAMSPAAFFVGLRSLAYLPGPVESTTSTLRAGVSYRRLATRDPRPRVVHVLRIDLRTPGVRLATTRPADVTRPLPYDARTTSAFARETGAFAAINGDFFDPWTPGLFFGYPKPGDPVRTLSTTYVAGEPVTTQPARRGARMAVGPGSHAAFADAPRPGGDLLGGLCMIVEEGKPAPIEPCETKQPDVRHPRTAVGLDARAETLLLVVVDGRQPRYSQGAELSELAAALIAAGAHAAMNVDGGGSSTLVARDDAGAVALLNRPIADRVPGRERPVANHLGVYFDR